MGYVIIQNICVLTEGKCIPIIKIIIRKLLQSNHLIEILNS